jgi:predicted RNase H-related nuclease YkuK (DUF458 family)
MKDKYVGKFKRFGGEFIEDISEYLCEYINDEPEITIAIGNDSKQRRKRTMYANTIMFYNHDIKNGAHVVFYRESVPKIYDTFSRLYREAEFMFELGSYLQERLEPFYVRKDLTDAERRRYKLHLLREQGQYRDVHGYEEQLLLKNLHLTEAEKNQQYKLVDIHLDFNYEEGKDSRNKSYTAYKAAAPWLRGQGFRVWTKPNAFASTSAADLLLKS